MDVNVIEIKYIFWPKTSKEDRTHDADFIKKMALSIENDGLLQPIGVRPYNQDGFKYKGVFGRHRSAAFLSLRREVIPAVVFIDMNDEEAAIAQDAENLWRNPLTKAQGALAMKRWYDAYDKKRVAYAEALAAQKAAEKAASKPPAKPKTPKGKKAGDTDQVQSGPEATPEPTPAPVMLPPLPPKPPENFARHAAEVTGMSETAVKRQLKIGKAFTPTQFEILEQQGVNQTWQDTIANLDQARRDAVVNLIASGKSEDESISIVYQTPEVMRADGKGFVVEPVPPGQKADNDLTDDEWVKLHCADILKLLEDPTPFTTHAILYRETRDIRQAFKNKAKGPIANARKANAFGGALSVITRLINLAHPSKWLCCGDCKGIGIVEEGTKQKKCPTCGGNAFLVKMESK